MIPMTSDRLPLDEAARRLLATFGLQGVWDVHLAATAAHGAGKAELAASLTELAEAAEQAVMAGAALSWPS